MKQLLSALKLFRYFESSNPDKHLNHGAETRPDSENPQDMLADWRPPDIRGLFQVSAPVEESAA